MGSLWENETTQVEQRSYGLCFRAIDMVDFQLRLHECSNAKNVLTATNNDCASQSIVR